MFSGSDNRYFRTALLLSAAVHVYAISNSAQLNYRQPVAENKIKQTELVHLVRAVEPEQQPVIEPVELAKPLQEQEPEIVSRRYFHSKIEELPLKPDDEKISEFEDLKPQEVPIFLDYYQTIREEIRRMTVYPYVAKKDFIEGTAYLSFVLLRNGNIKEIDLKQSSGHQLLDRNASWSIKRASPFPPFPEGLSQDRLRLNVQITYKLN